ncbi:hypothetical protein KJ810_00970 [Patescibacteria group bacterium]|nr:hypothetical protein [Patescibacteria group bacterium]MBU2236229.1 hypothetical protein [Patescibacteria group bacterium]
MAKSKLKKPPEWLYPLYKPSDKTVFDLLLLLGNGKIKPKMISTQKDISKFIKLLIVTQKIKKYRTFRDMVLRSMKKNNTLNLPSLNAKGEKMKIPRGVDKSWAIFTQDQQLCLLIDRLNTKNVEYNGTPDDVIEFMARFLLTQLLQDWRGPKMMVVIESLKTRKVRLEKLNRLLKYWDFTNEFKS